MSEKSPETTPVLDTPAPISGRPPVRTAADALIADLRTRQRNTVLVSAPTPELVIALLSAGLNAFQYATGELLETHRAALTERFKYPVTPRSSLGEGWLDALILEPGGSLTSSDLPLALRALRVGGELLYMAPGEDATVLTEAGFAETAPGVWRQKEQ